MVDLYNAINSPLSLDMTSNVGNSGGGGMDPYTMLLGAGMGGLGGYFQGQAQQQQSDNERQMQEAQLAQQQAQFNTTNQIKNNQNIGATAAINNGYNTNAYGGAPLNYVNPLQGGMNDAITQLMSGQLAPSQVAQQNADISKGSEMINSNASGMPAGARMGLQNQNVQQISRDYANMANSNIGQGVSLANSAANTGMNIAGQNYNSGFNAYLTQMQAQNQKANALAGYAPGGV